MLDNVGHHRPELRVGRRRRPDRRAGSGRLHQFDHRRPADQPPPDARRVQDSIIAILPPAYLSVLVFHVAINGIPALPSTGCEIIYGDPQSYFYAQAPDFTITQQLSP